MMHHKEPGPINRDITFLRLLRHPNRRSDDKVYSIYDTN